MVEISDGVVLAEKDLIMRGPGQFFGYRQHGLPEFKLASLADDLSLLETSRNDAMKALADPSDSLTILASLENRYSDFFGFHFTG